MANFRQKYVNKIRRIKALVVKEYFQIIRDSSSILIAFIFPLILLFIYGYGVSLDMDDLKVGVVLEDTGPAASSFYYSLRNSKFFSTKIARHKYKLEEELTAGKIRGLVTVPFYFSEFLYNDNKIAPIYVIADGSEPNTANFVQNYVRGAWYNWMTQEYISNAFQKGPKIVAQPRFWFNERLDSKMFLIPGSIAIIMTLIGSLLTALVVAREWERGTMEALMSTRVTMREIYLSKIIAYFCLGMFSMIICTLVGVFLFRVPFHGSIFLLILVSSIFLLTSLGSGLFISIATRSQFLASQLAITTAFLPAFMLSGFIFEISSMPFIIRCISYVIPAKYFVTSLQSLFLVGNVFHLMLLNILILIFIAIVFLGVIFYKNVKRLD